MDRLALCDTTLARLMRGGAIGMGSPEAADPPAGAGPRDSFALALRSLELSWVSEFRAASEHAEQALPLADDPDALALARAMASLSLAGCDDPAFIERLRDPRTGGDPLRAALADTAPLNRALARPICALLAEAALACARLDLAIAFLARMRETPDALFDDDRHPFLVFVSALEARACAFSGDITGAQAHIDLAVAQADAPIPAMFARSCAALVAGNADQRARTRALISAVEGGEIPIVDALTRGCWTLTAFAATAIGDHARAARLVLASGGDTDLSKLRIIDRAWGFEMLIAEAAERSDRDAAILWLMRAAPLAHNPISAASFDRMSSRLALLDGRFDAAIAGSARGAQRARSDQRGIEVAEAEILLARSRIAARQAGDAARQLSVIASSARDSGHRSAHRAAGRELRRIGRRLPPDGTGWDGLSPRERDVARLIARGRSNAEIAREMYVSESTARVHVSRILRILGVTKRAAVAAALTGPTVGTGDLPSLTARQRDVVALIATGATNRAIAQQLGIGVTTVEKHVSAVFARWAVGSRTEVAHLTLSGAHTDR